MSRRSGPTRPEHLRKRPKVGCRLLPEQIGRLDEVAKRRGLSRAALIEELLVVGLEDLDGHGVDIAEHREMQRAS